MAQRTYRSSSLGSSVSSASTTELEARQKATNSRLLELEDEQIEVEEADNGLPSPQSISITMDEYISASIVGRSSFASGDLLQAVTQFNEALGIELQTELECLYDTNLGFVSGLVRREVEHRLQATPEHQDNKTCSKILNQLADVYIKASSQSDSHPNKAKWYLRMGAALCVVNEWEKAKQIYREGINMCKDKKDLKAALKNLIKLEQITSSADVPPEDRYDQLTTPQASPAKSVQSLPTRPHTPSPRLERRRSRIRIRRRSKSVSAESRKRSLDNDKKVPLEAVDSILDLPQGKPRSDSLDSEGDSPLKGNSHIKITRSGSTYVPRSPNQLPRKSSDPAVTSPLAVSDGLIQLRTKKEKKFALNILNGKRNSISGFFTSLGRNHPTPMISSEDKQQWTECFSPDGCTVASYHTMTTSAVAHMRKLSVEPQRRGSQSGGSDDQKDGGGGGIDPTTPRRMTFNAINFTSMKIDSDDSELDDD